MAWRYYIAAIAATLSLAQSIMAKPLDIEDVLKTVSIDKVDPSPDGRNLAVVIQRPVGGGEVFGRTAYEIDPSRTDVWLIGRDGSTKSNLTHGDSQGAGFWCAQWSPDSKRLAMLSTKPEGNEPYGGNSVRLYVWERDGARLTRLSERAMMTQTRYGSPLNALDLRVSDRSLVSKVCRRDDENAPFLWLDARRLLVVQMPPGQNSSLFTQQTRPLEYSSEILAKLHAGRDTTADISDSDRTALLAERGRYIAEIAVIDVVSGERRLLGEVPAFPFKGMLSLLVSPDGQKLAIFAPSGVIAPHLLGDASAGRIDVTVEKMVGILRTRGEVKLRWFPMPPESRYPLDPLTWSRAGDRLFFRAREKANDRSAKIFALNTNTGETQAVAANLVSDPSDVGPGPHRAAVIAQDDGSLLVRGREITRPGVAEQWWYVEGARPPQLTAAPTASEAIPGLRQGFMVLAQDTYGVVWQHATPQGLRLGVLRKGDTSPHDLLVINQHLAMVDWGEVRMIDYMSISGSSVKGMLIFPPGYRPEKQYPLLVWVYPGNSARSLSSYWNDPYLPGIYNLQLYAAKDYVVLVPSMPFKWGVRPTAIYEKMTDGVLPAVDKVVSLGIADPGRIGVFGQSFGGYAVYALITQTDRFAAAVAMSGFPDLTEAHGAFDPAATGWKGIGQDKSDNPTILQMGNGLGYAPYDRPDFYKENSPLNYVARVRTPLLMAHGTLDVRTGIHQVEAFFTELDQQGKPARLLRYEGENHSLAASPANVRHLFGETIAWFDRYLKPSEK